METVYKYSVTVYSTCSYKLDGFVDDDCEKCGHN